MFLDAPASTLEELVKGQLTAALVDTPALYQLKQLEEKEYVPALSLSPIPTGIFSCQWMGLVADRGKEKQAAAEAFFCTLYEEENQKRLLEYWSFPVRAGLSDYLPEELWMASLWEYVRGEALPVVGAFSYEDIRTQYREKQAIGVGAGELSRWLRSTLQE